MYQYLDRKAFKELENRMRHKFPMLLEIYLRDAKAYMVTIEANLPSRNLVPLIEAAHSFKSSSSLFGVEHVAREAERIEYEGKNLQNDGTGSLDNLNNFYKNLQNAFSLVESDLRAELDKVRSRYQ